MQSKYHNADLNGRKFDDVLKRMNLPEQRNIMKNNAFNMMAGPLKGQQTFNEFSNPSIRENSFIQRGPKMMSKSLYDQKRGNSTGPPIPSQQIGMMQNGIAGAPFG